MKCAALIERNWTTEQKSIGKKTRVYDRETHGLKGIKSSMRLIGVTSCGLVLRLRLYEFDSRRQIFLRLLNEAGCYLSQLLR
jgi:hypothetical protein